LVVIQSYELWRSIILERAPLDAVEVSLLDRRLLEIWVVSENGGRRWWFIPTSIPSHLIKKELISSLSSVLLPLLLALLLFGARYVSR